MDNQPALPPVIDESRLNAMGETLFRQFGIYETGRRMVEEKWLKALRAVRKIHDPEVLSMIAADRSKAYPGITQYVVRGTIARLMQLLFPMTEKNYNVSASKLPDLSTEQLQQVLDQLQQADPTAELSDDQIEKAIVAFAAGKAERMGVKVEDDLQAMDFVTLVRKMVKSAVTYSVGILRGPLHEKVKGRTWQRDPNTGKYNAVEVDKFKPIFEFLPVWDHYPDLTAVSLDKQSGWYDRHVMTRQEVEALAKRPDFLAARIILWLVNNSEGNFKEKWWEQAIKAENKAANATVYGKQTSKYEVLSYWGYVTGHDLRAAGNTVADADLGASFWANAWMIDNVTIKCRLAPLGDEVKTHHYFVFEDDDLSILGNGQADTMRDSQLSIGECARAGLDNMSVIGPLVEVNDDLVTPGQDLRIRKHMTIHREGEGASAQIPAVRNINIESHLTELIAMINLFQTFADKESGLPPPSVGDVSGGGSEALRTTKNASMFLGAAALPIRDTVRNYDTFTVSAIGSLVAWNMKFDPNPTRDGDHDVLARGSTSLIAKEVLSTALNEFRASVTPDEMPHLKTRGMLIARMKANDLPLDDLLEDEDVAEKNVAAQQAQQQAAMQVQHDLVDAQVHEVFAAALEHVAKAQTEGVTSGVDVLTALTSALAAGHAQAAERQKNAVAAFTAGHAAVAAHAKNSIALKVANKPAPARAA